MYRHTAVILALLLTSGAGIPAGTQRTVKVSDAWIKATSQAETSAFATVENGTMYDVYVVGAATDVAGTVELVRTAGDKTTTVEEVSIPAFDRLEMSPQGTFLRLFQLKRVLTAGEMVTITLQTDSGEQLSVNAVVK